MLSVVKATWPEPKTSFKAYKTLVPMSPYTTPMAPRVRAAIEDLLEEDTKNQPSSKTGLLFRVTAILRLFWHLDHGGEALKDSAV